MSTISFATSGLFGFRRTESLTVPTPTTCTGGVTGPMAPCFVARHSKGVYSVNQFLSLQTLEEKFVSGQLIKAKVVRVSPNAFGRAEEGTGYQGKTGCNSLPVTRTSYILYFGIAPVRGHFFWHDRLLVISSDTRHDCFCVLSRVCRQFYLVRVK